MGIIIDITCKVGCVIPIRPTVFPNTNLKLSTDSDLVLKLDDESEIAGMELRIAKFNVTINHGGNFYAGEVPPL